MNCYFTHKTLNYNEWEIIKHSEDDFNIKEFAVTTKNPDIIDEIIFMRQNKFSYEDIQQYYFNIFSKLCYEGMGVNFN